MIRALGGIQTCDRVEMGSQIPAPRANTQLQHAVYRSFDDAIPFRKEWDEFVGSNDGDLFSTFDWCRIWWRHYGDRRKLEIHIFRSEGRIVGLVPAFRETFRFGPISVRLIRLLGCDHSTTTCGVVVDRQHLEPAIEVLAVWLEENGGWDMVHWGPLAGYFQDREAISKVFARHASAWSVCDCADDGPHIIWELPKTYKDYLSSLTSNERRGFKNARKRLADSRIAGDPGAGPEEVLRIFGRFVEQHQSQWRAKGQLGHFTDWPKALEFHQELATCMAALGRLWLLRLDVGDQPIGFQYNYRFGVRIHWLLAARDVDSKWDAYGSGRVLHAQTVEEAITGGFREIDGLRGMYEHKLRLGGKLLKLQSIALIRAGFWSEVRVRLARGLARALDLAYYRIWFGRIAPRLPLPRRGLWKLWIRSRF